MDCDEFAPAHSAVWSFGKIPFLRPNKVLLGAKIQPEGVELLDGLTILSCRVPFPSRIAKWRIFCCFREHSFLCLESWKQITIDWKETLRDRYWEWQWDKKMRKRRTSGPSPKSCQIVGSKNLSRCLSVKPRSRAREGGAPRLTSSNTVSASGSGTSDALCESYQARSYLWLMSGW